LIRQTPPTTPFGKAHLTDVKADVKANVKAETQSGQGSESTFRNLPL